MILATSIISSNINDDAADMDFETTTLRSLAEMIMLHPFQIIMENKYMLD